MSFTTLRLDEYVDKFGKIFGLLDVKSELDVKHEIPRVIELLDDAREIVRFSSIKGFKSFVSFSNLINLRDKIARLLNVSSDAELYRKILSAEEDCRSLSGVTLVSGHDYKVVRDVDLSRLPFAKFYDGEPYCCLTSGVVLGLDLESKFINASIHRLSVVDKDKFVIRLSPRHLYTIWQNNMRKGWDTPVAIVWGVNPVFLLAAACSPPYGYYEISMIEKLIGIRPKFVQLENGVIAPVDAEIVFEGYISKDLRAPEGPFVDLLKLYDEVREQPIVKISRIYVRADRDVHYVHTLLTGSNEHSLLMGIEKEAKIWMFVSNVVPEVKAVRLTKSSGRWLHAVVSIRKATDGDAKNAILAAFAAHPSLKSVVVIDDDVNVDDPNEVEWAVATRFRADEDLVIIKHVRGSTLDPSAIDQMTGLTTKIGIDATKPLAKDVRKFVRARIPSRLSLSDLKIERVY